MGDKINGDKGDNYLLGGLGDDTLNGGAGADTMEGAAGNDLYFVDNAGDVVVENAGEGRDTVRSSVDWALGENLENLVLLGSAASGSGNALDNRITGNDNDNDLFGGDGNDTLNGGDGGDILIGGAGDDVYVIDSELDGIAEDPDQGRDTVRSSISLNWSFGLGANLEDIVLLGNAVFAIGNELDNRITGNDNDNNLSGGEGNDTLNGGVGADTLTGGNGDDLYIVDNEWDVVAIENYEEGHDTVRSSVYFSLYGNNYLEDLVLVGSEDLTGAGNFNANKITGNSGDNFLVGWDGDDSLSGGQGNDYLDGGIGSDTMRGGIGDDAYIVDDAGDKVIEAAGGGTDDLVFAGVDYTLGANLENMRIYGGTHFVGNNGSNAIFGDGGNVVTIDGGAGDDVLWTQTAGCTLIGGAGNDYLIFSFNNGVVVEKAGGGEDTIEVWQDIDLANYANVENLNVFGAGRPSPVAIGMGNALANKISGDFVANIFNGADGNDTLDGGGGFGSDTLYGGNGDDRIQGSHASDLLDGGDGADTLVAGAGADQLTGGTGRDIFVVGEIGGLDTVTDFESGAGGDALDLGDILIGYDGVTSDANDFVKFTSIGDDTLVQVDSDGVGGSVGFIDTVLLKGVTLTDVGQAIADGNLILQSSEIA
jgi:Ca2+-binding RTX toxin-like protein